MAGGRIYPVVMCGGAGTRLWPESRPERPKQFLALTGAVSMFQQAVERVAGIPQAEAPIIVGGVRHVAAIQAQLAEIGVAARLVVEPEPRDSAPAIAAAALLVAETDPGGVAVVIASDHHVPDPAAFRAAIVASAAAARDGAIVTLGVRPTVPSSAYGYIRPRADGRPIPAVDAFIEKPDEATARQFVDAGYLWNSGNFVFAAQTLIDELERFAPDILNTVRPALRDAERAGGTIRLGAGFRAAPRISIDYAVMERTQRAAVLPVDFVWSDLGAWNAVWDASAKDGQGNAAVGAHVLEGARDCLIRNGTDATVAAIDVARLAIIVEPNAVLICPLDSSQRVKTVAERAASAAVAPARPAPDGAAPLAAIAERLERWLFCSALPLWWSLGADHAGGGFHEVLGEAGVAPPAPRRMRVQARQAFVFAMAGRMGWAGPWAAAADHGLRYLADRYRRADGLYRTCVAADGSARDETAMVYDQAFVLLAWAARQQADPSRMLEQPAQALLAQVRAAHRHPGGGLVETGGALLSNPLMHMLEACLAWAEASGAPVWDEMAGQIVELALSRLIDPAGGFLREHFRDDWRPAAGPDGRLVEPGHQFEWAWLLQRWALRHDAAEAARAARRLFRAGTTGLDAARGVVVDALNDDGTVRTARARLWPQTEWLKAALILSRAPAPGGGTDAVSEDDVRAAAAALARYLETATPGLWHDKLEPTNRFVAEPAPASSLYHIFVAIAELAAFVRTPGA